MGEGGLAVFPEHVLQAVDPMVGSQVVLEFPFVEEAELAAWALADSSGDLRFY